MPPGACDCHFHFIGPQKQFTLKPNHVFSHLQFEDTPIDDWLKMQEALGLSRGLHVLSMMYEHNYEIALHAQNRLGDRIRSVIVPWPDITDGELDILTKAGVVGYRITWRLTRTIDQKMVARTCERGWSMHYLHRADEHEMDAWKPHILKTPGRFVLEHMGGVDPAKGIDGEGFKFVLQCLDTGRCWVKLARASPSRTTSRSRTATRWSGSSFSTRRTGCCGARTGPTRSTSSRCRTMWRCSTRCSTGCPTRRPAR